LKDSTVCSRILAPVSRIVFLSVLAATVVVLPPCSTAQQPVPVTQTASAPGNKNAAQPVSTGSEAAKPKQEKSEQEENNVYRHAPVVQTIARMIHLDLETTARLFEGINFLIIVLAIGIPLFRALPKTLRKRSEKVRTDIDSARKATDDAKVRLSAIEEKLSGLDKEISRIRAQVKEDSEKDEERIKAAAAEESSRIIAAAELEIDSSALQAQRNLRRFAADLAIEQAAKQLVLTPENDRALIAEFLSDSALYGAPGNGAKQGGQN
jgi:F-type H+-transporting ATPase subunit b